MALKNALRYIPKELHETLAPEFMEELRTRGRIYGYRYRPQGDLKAKPIDEYKGRCIEGKAFQVMIDNNLCFDIAPLPLRTCHLRRDRAGVPELDAVSPDKTIPQKSLPMTRRSLSKAGIRWDSSSRNPKRRASFYECDDGRAV